MTRILCLCLLSASALLLSAQNSTFLNPITTFGGNGDGSLRPGDQVFISTGNAQRGLAFNPATTNLVFVDRAAGGGGSPDFSGGIYVLHGQTGAELASLNSTGISGGAFADLAVGVSDDGVIYVGNLVNDGTTMAFKLYRWQSETNQNEPALVYQGDPGNGIPQRWGDTMDIRGGGTNTQILLGSRPAGSIAGTNAAILTTADGVNFTAKTISLGVADSASAGGIAFGSGNTFWTKNLDSPLRQFSFDLQSGTATVARTFGPDVFPSSRNLEALAVDANGHLLAIVDFVSGVDRIRLYDIADTANAPVLLDIREFPVDNANGTTTKGYLDFGGGRLYVHSMNNGLLAFTLGSKAPAAPSFIIEPVTERVLGGRTVRLESLAYPAANYQWQRNGQPIAGATQPILALTNAQPADSGIYRVTARNAGGTTTSREATISVVRPEDLYHLTPLWSAAPGGQPYVTSNGGANTPNERGMAYNPLSNHVYVAQRNANNYTVHVIDGSTGTKLYNLKTNGITLVVRSEVSGANGIGLVAIDVAEDGAIYACNASPNAAGGSDLAPDKMFRVYRWANAHPDTEPVQIFEGDPAGQTGNLRWGDVLRARGSGAGTQLLLDNQNPNPAPGLRFMAILRPTNAALSGFSATGFQQDNAIPFGASIGRGIDFGTGNTLWQKRRSAALVHSRFDVAAATAQLVAAHTNFPAGLGLSAVDESRNLLAGINFVTSTTVPDTLDLYDISDRANPLLLGQYNFPANHVANNNFIGRALISGNRVYALNGNNGIVAYTLGSGPKGPPVILRQPQDLRVVSGGTATFTVATADIVSFQWQKEGTNIVGATNSTLALSNAQAGDAGTYRVIVGNDSGTTTSSNAVLTVKSADDFHSLSRLWSLAPESRPYLMRDTDGQGRTPLYRSIAYHAASNQVILVTRGSQTGGLLIPVLNATTGADLYELNLLDSAGFSPISGGSIVLLSVAVAEDGSIYASNMDTSGTAVPAVYNLYRWANSAPTTSPALVFSGEPAGLDTPLRWGDTLDIRGGGANTEIIIDANSGALAAILKPVDATLASFTSSSFSQTYGSGSIGRSLEFGAGNTFWQKRKGTRLQQSSFDLASKSSVAITNITLPESLGPVGLDLSRNLLAGINFSTNAPDTLDLYDLADFTNPLLVASYPFPENARPNGHSIGQVLFAGDRVFAVDGNNGVMAFRIQPPAGSVSPKLEISRSGSSVVLSWPLNASSYRLERSAALVPANWEPAGDPTVVNGQNTVTENAGTGTRFYRLRK